MGRRIICVFFFVLVLLALAGAAETGIYTNAQPGSFAGGQWLWFSVNPGESLRLLLDGVELYRGPGPGTVFLDAGKGEERSFELSAERYAPVDSRPREVRVFVIRLDKRAAEEAVSPLQTNEAGAAALMAGADPSLDIFVSGTGMAAEGRPGTGTREDPFVHLDDAVSLARRTGRDTIRLSGRAVLRGSLEISGNIAIIGSPAPGANRAAITIPRSGSIRIHRGIFRIQGVTVEKEAAPSPGLYLGRGAGFELSNAVFSGGGPLIWVEENGVCLISDSLLSPVMAEDRRLPALSAGRGQIHLRRSHGALEGIHGLFAGMMGGVLSVENCFFRIEAERSGTLFNLDGVRADISGLSAFVSAGDYGAVAELRNSRLVMLDSGLSVSARDGLLVLSEDSEALYARTGFSLVSSFVARALELSGRFPVVSECYFNFSGFARQAEVFSVRPGPRGRIMPGMGAVGGSVFKGFTHILGPEYPKGGIAAFNRAFAPEEKPNTLAEEAPGARP